jgi:hypothetical protein
MNKRIVKIVSIVVILLTACTRDFIVGDISKKQLRIIAPTNNTKTTANRISIKWDEIADATAYKVEIVSPSFDAVQRYVIDSTTSKLFFDLTLNPGIYQIRVYGRNDNSVSLSDVVAITIDSTSDLSKLTVTPSLPLNNTLTNSSSIYFTWNTIYSANQYQCQIFKNNGLALDTMVNTSAFFKTLTEGAYTWHVKAMNATSATAYSAVQKLRIDKTAPIQPNLLLPSNDNQLVRDTNFMEWFHAPDVWFDSLYLSYDANFNTVLLKQRMLIGNKKIKINLLTPPLQIGNGSYVYWKLRSVDSAGNTSLFSDTYKFKLIQ